MIGARLNEAGPSFDRDRQTGRRQVRIGFVAGLVCPVGPVEDRAKLAFQSDGVVAALHAGRDNDPVDDFAQRVGGLG